MMKKLNSSVIRTIGLAEQQAYGSFCLSQIYDSSDFNVSELKLKKEFFNLSTENHLL
ncbi:hypothetical protein ABEY61_30285 [Bacillus toyonensis]|uniref:hypothetical protein n=1 Tax=Bacillus toyonensis TaxID=155322 RepID=UPI003D240870